LSLNFFNATSTEPFQIPFDGQQEEENQSKKRRNSNQ
jgi:hypothetical protein